MKRGEEIEEMQGVVGRSVSGEPERSRWRRGAIPIHLPMRCLA